MECGDLCLLAQRYPQSAIIQRWADWTDGYVLWKKAVF